VAGRVLNRRELRKQADVAEQPGVAALPAAEAPPARTSRAKKPAAPLMAETVSVTLTGVRGGHCTGVLAARPAVAAFAKLRPGATIAITAHHVHSVIPSNGAPRDVRSQLLS